MHSTAFVLAVAVLLGGCASAPRTQRVGGIRFVERAPLVTLSDTVSTDDSPGVGYVVSPFPMSYFPLVFVKAGISGEVLVRIVVGPDGKLRSSRVLSSSQREFEAPTLAAIERWCFLEAPTFGVKEKVGMTLDCRVKFDFDES
jgi:TonB family protein